MRKMYSEGGKYTRESIRSQKKTKLTPGQHRTQREKRESGRNRKEVNDDNGSGRRGRSLTSVEEKNVGRSANTKKGKEHM